MKSNIVRLAQLLVAEPGLLKVKDEALESTLQQREVVLTDAEMEALRKVRDRLPANQIAQGKLEAVNIPMEGWMRLSPQVARE